jgi:hypothetical protein
MPVCRHRADKRTGGRWFDWFPPAAGGNIQPGDYSEMPRPFVGIAHGSVDAPRLLVGSLSDVRTMWTRATHPSAAAANADSDWKCGCTLVTGMSRAALFCRSFYAEGAGTAMRRRAIGSREPIDCRVAATVAT